ncbi:MAG: DUF1579 family protein [Planctomycetota bacterium]|nr:DUF1579 family protein [Planctomycetota bacterium]
MKKSFVLSLLSLTLLATLSLAMAQDEKENPYAALQKPGAAHKVFEGLVGDWDVVQKVWEQPGATAKVSKGSMKRALKYGGRFLQDTILVKEKNKTVTTIAMHGYNNWSKEFQTTVYHDNDTGMYHYTGNVDKKSGLFVMTGTWSILMNGKKMVVGVRSVMTRSAKKEVMTLYFKYPNIDEHKAGEMTYTRKATK